MVKHFNHNFGFVAEEIFEQGILENLDRCFDSFKKNCTLTPLSTLIEKFLQKLKLEPCVSIQYLLRNVKRF